MSGGQKVIEGLKDITAWMDGDGERRVSCLGPDGKLTRKLMSWEEYESSRVVARPIGAGYLDAPAEEE